MLIVAPISAILEYNAKLFLTLAVSPHAQVETKFVYPAVKVAQIAWDSITPDFKLP
jgi:ATP citrate (pro-S)-lyase